jgi:hypothetical protein
MKPKLETTQVFDSDSIPIAVDPCASASIFTQDTFFTSWSPVKGIFLAGVGGKIPIKGHGTARFLITDDMGRKQNVRIDNAYYAPQSPLNLLCPQQWATQRNNRNGQADDAKYTVKPEDSKLSWSGGKQIKTVKYNASNIPILYTTSGFTKFSAFACGIIQQDFVAFPAAEISDTESESDDQDDDLDIEQNKGERAPRSLNEHTFFPLTKTSLSTPLHHLQ